MGTASEPCLLLACCLLLAACPSSPRLALLTSTTPPCHRRRPRPPTQPRCRCTSSRARPSSGRPPTSPPRAPRTTLRPCCRARCPCWRSRTFSAGRRPGSCTRRPCVSWAAVSVAGMWLSALRQLCRRRSETGAGDSSSRRRSVPRVAAGSAGDIATAQWNEEGAGPLKEQPLRLQACTRGSRASAARLGLGNYGMAALTPPLTPSRRRRRPHRLARIARRAEHIAGRCLPRGAARRHRRTTRGHAGLELSSS
jgi:hypothetical protein